MKELYWVGTSLDDLKELPEDVVQMAGYQLHRIQSGQVPADWKPMTSIGQGVKEIRIQESTNAYRIIHLVITDVGVYVLHAFQKKTQKTSQSDINLAKRRYKEVKRGR